MNKEHIIEFLHDEFQNSIGICTDTRKLKPDELFFALKGPSFNGNKFAQQALDEGARIAIIDEGAYQTNDNRTILVNDVLTTLQKLASFHRKKLSIPIIGVTGSNGKTTTKELLKSVLSTQYKTLSTQGNLNNHIGVPLTLLRLNKDHDIAIVEMGANHVGEIKQLCEIAAPNYGIITSIGKAHLEGFGSLQGIINTKSELFDFIKQHKGVFFLNATINELSHIYESSYSGTIPFGTKECKIYSQQVTSSTPLCLSISDNGTIVPIESNLLGNFHRHNVLAVYSIAKHFDVSTDNIQKAIKNYSPKNNRSQLVHKNGNEIILDAYNANPASMKEAIDYFVTNKTSLNKVLILGDMFELGTYSIEEHTKIVEILNKVENVEVILIGNEFGKTTRNSNINYFETVTQAIDFIKRNTYYNNQFLIKGSRGMALEQLVEYL